MTPYKILIAAVAFLLIGGAGYYFNSAGVPDLVTQDIRQGGEGKSYGVTAVESYSGVYECTPHNGCPIPIRLILGQDTTLDVIAKVNDEDVSYGQGIWKIGAGGSLVFALHTSGAAPDGSPTSFLAKKVSLIKISGIYSKTGLWPDVTNPTFSRIEVMSKTATGDN